MHEFYLTASENGAEPSPSGGSASGKSKYYLLLLEGAYHNLTNFAKSEISDLTNLVGLCTK